MARRGLLVLFALMPLAWANPAATQASAVKAVVRSRFDAVGPWASMMTSQTGGGADGLPAFLVLKGSRLLIGHPAGAYTSSSQPYSEIIDFDVQKMYRVNYATEEYTIQSFSELRSRVLSSHGLQQRLWREADPRLLPSTGVDMPAQSAGRAKRFEYSVDVKETGRERDIAGYHTREAVVVVTATEQGKTLDKDGGWVATSTVWLAARIPDVDELVAAQRRYAKALTNGVFDAAFTRTEFPLYEFFEPRNPEHPAVSSRVISEVEKLNGTVLSSSTVYEIERTAKEWQSAKSQYEAQQQRLTTSGARVLGGDPPKRMRLITMELEYSSIDHSVADEEVTVPAGYKKK